MRVSIEEAREAMAEMKGIPLGKRIADVTESVRQTNSILLSISYPPGFQSGDETKEREPPDTLGCIESQLKDLEYHVDALHELVTYLKQRLT